MRAADRSRRSIVIIVAIIATILLVIGALGLPRSIQAAPSALPPRPGYDPDSGGSDADDRLIGAYIEVQVQPAQTGMWTVVQWQDSAGDWRDVEGWKGWLEADGHLRWWVAAKDFNTGPFQWVIYRKPGSLPLASSAPFNLPQRANEIERIEVLFGP